MVQIDISTIHFDPHQKFVIDISPIQHIKHNYSNFNDVGCELHLYHFGATFCYLLHQEQDCADTKNN